MAGEGERWDTPEHGPRRRGRQRHGGPAMTHEALRIAGLDLPLQAALAATLEAFHA